MFSRKVMVLLLCAIGLGIYGLAQIVAVEYFAPSLNGFALILGLAYFFERLRFDKHTTFTKNRRERVEAVYSQLVIYDDLVEDLFKFDKNDFSTVIATRNKLQTQSARITKRLERLQSADLINKSISKPIMTYFSKVENADWFLCDQSTFPPSTRSVALSSIHFCRGIAFDAVFEELFRLDRD